MQFNSYLFIFIFMPLVLIGWYGLNRLRRYRLAEAFLAGMSLWFYGYFNTYYLAIILVSMVLNYFLSFLLTKIPENAAHTKLLYRLAMAIGVTLNLGILFYYKYYDFFIENINAAFHTDFALKHILLPLGIGNGQSAASSLLLCLLRHILILLVQHLVVAALADLLRGHLGIDAVITW